MRAIAVVVIGVVWLAHASVRANDSAFGGHGSDLAPIAENRIRMASERIEIELVPDRAAGESGREMAWRVQATYRFVNPTSERIALQMGFPEVRCDESEGDCIGRGGVFRNMRTTVRGQTIRHRFGEVTRHPAWPELGRVFLYDVEFAPNEEVEIVHRYVHDRTFIAAGLDEELHYLTRTGASWNGPIGEAEFIVRVPYVPRAVAAHRDYPIERRLIREDGVPRGVALRSQVRELRPTNDFTVLLSSPGGMPTPQFAGVDCPMFADVADAAPDEVSPTLTSVPTDALRLCAAALETQYGADPGPELSAALERARMSRETLDTMVEGFVVVPPHPLPEFTPEWMPPEERAYVARLKEEAARRPAESPTAAPSAVPPTPTPTSAPPPAPATAVPATSTSGCGACSAGATRENGAAALAACVFTLLALRWRRRQ